MLVYTYAGIVRQLNALTARVAAAPWTCRLYQNDAPLSWSTDTADLVEADFGGYAPVSLTTWTPGLIIGGTTAVSKTPPLDFTADGTGPANTVYGAWVADQLGKLVCYAPLPDGPQLMSSAGDFIELALNLEQSIPVIS